MTAPDCHRWIRRHENTKKISAMATFFSIKNIAVSGKNSRSMKKKEVKSDPKEKSSKLLYQMIAENRKAHYNYFLHEKYEAGVRLLGHEVKSIREHRVNLKDSYVRIMKEEAFLVNCHISPYSRIQGHQAVDPTQVRKLLLHRNEINRLIGQTGRKGHAIVPLRMYFKKGRIKVEIAVAEGKKQYDKREAIKKRIHDRESAAAIKRGKTR